MTLVLEGLREALRLLFAGDVEVWGVLALSLAVSTVATLIALAVGIPAGVALALARFPGRSLLIAAVNAGMGLPPVVVGLFVSIVLWRSGPLGWLEILYTPSALVIAQAVIASPIVTGITLAAVQNVPAPFRLQLVALGASRAQTVWVVLREARLPMLAAIMAGFGAVISEIGASMMVGGNIKGQTRTLTTAMVLETGRGNFEAAIALAILLLALVFAVNWVLTSIQQRRHGLGALLVLGATGLAGPGVAHGAELTFSVAISMKEAVEELGRRFVQSRPDVTLRYNLGSSGELQKQIEAGAPIDLFISAAERQMDELQHKGLIVRETRRVFARNVLVAVKPADSTIDLAKPADLLHPRVGKIVIGNPKTVPVGQYSEESLRALGLWDRLQPKLVFAENVRQALDYVARGEVDAGFVYSTDAALRRDRVKEAFRPPEDTYRPVTYPVAVVKDGKHRALAEAFIGLLTGRDGLSVLTRLGFQPPPAGAR